MIKFEHNRLLKILSILKVFVWVLAGYRPVVMHPYIFEKICFITQMFKVRAIVWAYGIDVWGNHGLKRAPSLGKATMIIAISTYTERRILENHPDAVVKVISLAVDSDNYSNTHSDRKNNQIITVGRLSSDEQYKGHDLIIEAVRRLKDEGLRVDYKIVGEGDDRPRLEALAKKFAVEDQVFFYGYITDTDIGEIYSSSSVFAMPSRVVKNNNRVWCGEGFGLVYLEAALHKLPVIACNEGGQTDCIVDGKTGFLVNPHVEEIADKIALLIKQPELAEDIGEAARKYVKANFSLRRFDADVVHVVEEVLG